MLHCLWRDWIRSILNQLLKSQIFQIKDRRRHIIWICPCLHTIFSQDSRSEWKFLPTNLQQNESFFTRYHVREKIPPRIYVFMNHSSLLQFSVWISSVFWDQELFAPGNPTVTPAHRNCPDDLPHCMTYRTHRAWHSEVTAAHRKSSSSWLLCLTESSTK